MIEHIDRRLVAWAHWKLGGGGGGNISPFPAYRNMGIDENTGWYQPGAPKAYVPVNDLECADTDRAVCALHPTLRSTVVVFYAGRGTTQQRMRDLGIGSRETLYKRLHEAHVLILGCLNDLSAGIGVPAWSNPGAKKVAAGLDIR